MSKYFAKVKSYYLKGFWTKKKVHDAVGNWITRSEYEQITGEKYSSFEE